MIRYIILSSAFLLSLLMGLVIIPNILLISHKKHLYDLPSIRKIHKVIVPQLGGVSFFPAILVSLCLVMGVCVKWEMLPVDPLFTNTTFELLFVAVGCMLLYLIGLADDLIGVSYRQKFIVQFMAAGLLVLSGDWFNHLGGLFGIYAISPIVGIPLTLLFIVYVINAINLIDGIDGLASGLCIIGLFTLSGMLIILQHDVYAYLSLAILGVLIPFWCYNVFGNAYKGHKLFMGDTGSLVLGYLLSFLVIRLSVHVPIEDYNPRQLILSVTPLLVPLLDVIRVIVVRARIGKNLFLPDKNHFHHKLLRTGMGIHSVLLFILATCLFFILFNYILINYFSITFLLLLDIIIWLTMHFILNHFVHANLDAIKEQYKDDTEGSL